MDAQGKSSEAEPGGVTKLPAGTPPDGELEQAIAALRARVDEEFRVTERLDSKTRQTIALAAGFFVVIQTVAFGSFAETAVTSTERVALLICAIAAATAVAVAAYKSSTAEGLVDERDVSSQAIANWVNEAGRNPEYVRARLVRGLANVAEARTANNEKRGERYEVVADIARLSLILSAVELIVAIVTRL